MLRKTAGDSGCNVRGGCKPQCEHRANISASWPGLATSTNAAELLRDGATRLDRQNTTDAATWLDRQLVGRHRVETALSPHPP